MAGKGQPREHLIKVGKKFSKDYQPTVRKVSAKPLTDLLVRELQQPRRIKVVAFDPKTKKKIFVILEATNKDVIIKALLDKAQGGDSKAIEIVLDRTEGKVPMPLQMSGQLELSAKSRQELSRLEDLDIDDAEFTE